QDEGAGRFAISLTAGAGYSHYLYDVEAPADIERSGMTANLRLMWHPDHRLRIGLESGWSRFYRYTVEQVQSSFGTTDASLSLSAVPLLVVFSMPVLPALEVFAGTGGYFVRSHATSFGSTVDVVAFSQGWMVAVAWTAGEWAGVRFATEMKWYGATQFEDGVLVLQLQGGMDLLRW
ncbi:MAG: hypothetical protein RRA94_00485, partial [Bacteroidota bacterium]|nr:hypothetical protein [Bacteroidota bacterium]